MKYLLLFALICASCGSHKINEPDSEPIQAHQDSLGIIQPINMDSLMQQLAKFVAKRKYPNHYQNVTD